VGSATLSGVCKHIDRGPGCAHTGVLPAFPRTLCRHSARLAGRSRACGGPASLRRTPPRRGVHRGRCLQVDDFELAEESPAPAPRGARLHAAPAQAAAPAGSASGSPPAASPAAASERAKASPPLPDACVHPARAPPAPGAAPAAQPRAAAPPLPASAACAPPAGEQRAAAGVRAAGLRMVLPANPCTA